ncbi:hypothetical protein VTK73DRAFT_3066 [Phialemonium thermophilum]|uniref:Uncharacterized protein n=1 Tax=Phialemonium thermophilum TaxID=223376 RepID=A0ABR3VMJ3_9PEZI
MTFLRRYGSAWRKPRSRDLNGCTGGFDSNGGAHCQGNISDFVRELSSSPPLPYR